MELESSLPINKSLLLNLKMTQLNQVLYKLSTISTRTIFVLPHARSPKWFLPLRCLEYNCA